MFQIKIVEEIYTFSLQDVINKFLKEHQEITNIVDVKTLEYKPHTNIAIMIVYEVKEKEEPQETKVEEKEELDLTNLKCINCKYCRLQKGFGSISNEAKCTYFSHQGKRITSMGGDFERFKLYLERRYAPSSCPLRRGCK